MQLSEAVKDYLCNVVPRRLLVAGSREAIIAWLVWNDGNGCYRDEDSVAEGYPVLTLETAREALRQILERG